jgi:RNA 2',3'-cyclic 3'-phosphodiesterase
MRIFTAIPLPQEVKDKFSEIARGRLPIAYVNTTNFHITLNFLGELDTDQLEKVKKFWQNDLPKLDKFKIEFQELIKFRHQIHMTVKDNPALKAMQSKLSDKFKALGFSPTFPKYYAHVTIGNMHMDKVMKTERKIENFPNEELQGLSFTAERIVLYESKLLLHHSKYIELDDHKLN